MSTNTNEQAVSLTDALAANAIPLSAVAAGKILLVAGVTGIAWRESSKPGRPTKSYKVATPLGESLGAVNEATTVPTVDPTHLKFDRNRFAALWTSKAVQDTLAGLLEVGDIHMRDGGAAKSEIF